jgi:tRNA (guanine37-N1)-methyltransferase
LARVRRLLAELIPPQKADLMYGAYDIIGDIILAKIPYELDAYEPEVGEALHRSHPSVTRVFRIVGETEEIERNRRLRLIWCGPDGKHEESRNSGLGRTIHKEHGCKFVVDVEKVFFTPRLSYERMRVAEQVKPGEVVASIFGGVGTYSIITAKVCPNVEQIYTIDVNPCAHELAGENIIINRCQEKVISILGDAKVICTDLLREQCDRVIMPLPEYANMFLEGATTALKEGTGRKINFYAVVSGKEVEKEAANTIADAERKLLDLGVKRCEVGGWRIVREVGPRKYHIAADLIVAK